MQMRANRILMKICTDIELSFVKINPTQSNKHTYTLVKFAQQLQKSIDKFEVNQDFKFALSMFPNKLRCENDKIEFQGERKIVMLIKEQII